LLVNTKGGWTHNPYGWAGSNPSSYIKKKIVGPSVSPTHLNRLAPRAQPTQLLGLRLGPNPFSLFAKHNLLPFPYHLICFYFNVKPNKPNKRP